MKKNIRSEKGQILVLLVLVLMGLPGFITLAIKRGHDLRGPALYAKCRRCCQSGGR